MIALLVLAPFVGALAWHVVLRVRRDRFLARMRAMVRTPIAGVPTGGLVRISGRLRLEAHGQAPFADFDVEDETGTARVLATGADMIVPSTRGFVEDAAVTVVGHVERAVRTSIRPIFVALIAACATPYVAARPPDAPTSLPSVNHRGETFQVDDGATLYEQSWLPSGEGNDHKAVVVIVHGLKDHGDRYDDFAAQLAGAGYAVYAADLRGHGRSSGRRVTVDDFDDYVDDLDALVTRVAAVEPGKPIFLFGHSMGGAIVVRYAELRPTGIAGIILSAPALRLDVPPIAIPFALLTGDLLPNFGGLKLDDRDFSSDPAVVASMKTDPFIWDAPGPAHTAAALIEAIGAIWDDLDGLTVPLLALHGSDDRVTSPRGSYDLVERAPAADRTLKTYAGFKHDLLHEPGRAQVVADVLAWLDARAGGATFSTPHPVTDSIDRGPAVSLMLDGRWRHGTPDLVDVALSARVAFGHYCLGADVGGGPHAFDGQLYATGIALPFASICAGAGGTLLGTGARVLFDVPVELRTEFQLGPIRPILAVRGIWIPANQDVGLAATIAVRLGEEHAYWPGAAAGSGPVVGFTAEKDDRGGWVGVLLGIDFSGE